MSAAIRKKPARSIADVGGGTILATVDIAAPIERVFQALTTAEVAKWWGSPETYRTTEWTADLRVGGKWRASGSGENGPFHVEGEILEIDAPRKIVQTWKPSWEEGSPTKLTYRLESIDGATRVTVRHEGFGDRVEACRSHGEGWPRVLGWLTGYVSPTSATEGPRFFLLRLLPPRATFAQDMTASEAQTMKAHAAYWMDHLAKGTAILFGLVADPKGGWGVGVVEVKDEAEVTALEKDDPAILAKIGLTYERLPIPMLRR